MKNNEFTLKNTALIAGSCLLLIFLFNIISAGFILRNLIVLKDAAETASNIMANTLLFRISLTGFVMAALCNLIAAWALYIFLIPVNSFLSLLAAWTRLIYSVVFIIALINHFEIIQLFGNPGNLDTQLLESHIYHSLYMFHHTWSLGFVLFGLHLITIGSLAREADYIPSILGILLMIAGFVYLVDFFIKLLIPEFSLNISMIAGLSEVIFMIWLLVKGKCIKERH